LPSGAEALSADFAFVARGLSVDGAAAAASTLGARSFFVMRVPVAPDYLPAGSTVSATASV